MKKAEEAVKKKHLVRTHIRAAMASVKVIVENCGVEDYKCALAALTILEIISTDQRVRK